MAIAVISGNGANRKTNFANIHYGGRSFQKATSTTHSQVQLVQQALNSAGYNCGNADGIFGEKNQNGSSKFPNESRIIPRWERTPFPLWKTALIWMEALADAAGSVFVRHVEYYLFGSGCYRRGFPHCS